MANEIVVGKVVDALGIKGWVKIRSFTEPPSNILSYAPWILTGGDSKSRFSVLTGRLQGGYVVASLEGINNRDDALALRQSDISIMREQLPDLGRESYYWVDLVGLAVSTVEGVSLGIVDGLIETGSNDVLVVNGDKERLIPFVFHQYVQAVDLVERRLVVSWDPEF